MTLIKSREDSRVGPPPVQLLQAIGGLGAQAAQAGVLIDTGGLMASATGALLRLESGSISTSDGPLPADQEVVGGYAIFEVPSKPEAIEWARRFMELHQQHWPGWEGTTEVRQMIQPPNPGNGTSRG